MASKGSYGFSFEKNRSTNAQDIQYPAYFRGDASSATGDSCKEENLASGGNGFWRTRSSIYQSSPNDISWNDGENSENTQDNTDIFRELIQNAEWDTYADDYTYSFSPFINQPLSHNDFILNGGQNKDSAEDNTERFWALIRKAIGHYSNGSARQQPVTSYATNSRTWLGVSRRDPRLRLSKYKDHLTKQAQDSDYSVPSFYHTDIIHSRLNSTFVEKDDTDPVNVPACNAVKSKKAENLGHSSRKRQRSASPHPDTEPDVPKRSRVHVDKTDVLKKSDCGHKMTSISKHDSHASTCGSSEARDLDHSLSDSVLLESQCIQHHL